MTYFTYKNGALYAEGVSVIEIAKEVSTPFYCYSSNALIDNYREFAKGLAGRDFNICFAVKANSNIAVLKTLASLGAGGDSVSEGEIRRCIIAGIPANQIVFSGVGKTRDEMAFALKSGIMQFNVESETELHLLNEVALSMSLKAPVAIRVNPDVDAKTHDKITTGRKGDKFGVEFVRAREIYNLASSMPGIEANSIAMHIGSQISSLTPFRKSFTRLRELFLTLKNDGHSVKSLDLGGGLGIPYTNTKMPSAAEYTQMVIETVGDLQCKLIFEPGRYICANAGILVSRVLYNKLTTDHKFVIIDAAMNDLMRPSLYDSYHDIIPVNEKKDAVTRNVDVVGPVCESGDVLAKQRPLPELLPDELVAIKSAGAYGAVMSSNYNTRLLIPEILVKDKQFSVIRKRETFAEIFARENIPVWL